MSQPTIATNAFLIADPTRAAMLTALMDGTARPAGELAAAAGVTPQTASFHLGKLLAGGLLEVETEGRHRYFRLSGPQVVQALETLATLGPPPARPPLSSRLSPELCFARCCYDHLAGRLGVAVTEGLLDRGFITPSTRKRYEVSPVGTDWFSRLGIDMAAFKPARLGLARQCLDWTERRHHLAGPLGSELMRRLCSSGWLRRSGKTRAVHVTPYGIAWMRRELGIDAGRALIPKILD